MEFKLPFLETDPFYRFHLSFKNKRIGCTSVTVTLSIYYTYPLCSNTKWIQHNNLIDHNNLLFISEEEVIQEIGSDFLVALIYSRTTSLLPCLLTGFVTPQFNSKQLDQTLITRLHWQDLQLVRSIVVFVLNIKLFSSATPALIRN